MCCSQQAHINNGRALCRPRILVLQINTNTYPMQGATLCGRLFQRTTHVHFLWANQCHPMKDAVTM